MRAAGGFCGLRVALQHGIGDAQIFVENILPVLAVEIGEALQAQQVKLPDGTSILLRKINADYDVHDRVAAINYLMSHDVAGEIPTGLVYLEDDPGDMHDRLNTVDRPLNELGDADLVPGSAALAKINASLR